MPSKTLNRRQIIRRQIISEFLSLLANPLFLNCLDKEQKQQAQKIQSQLKAYCKIIVRIKGLQKRLKKTEKATLRRELGEQQNNCRKAQIQYASSKKSLCELSSHACMNLTNIIDSLKQTHKENAARAKQEDEDKKVKMALAIAANIKLIEPDRDRENRFLRRQYDPTGYTPTTDLEHQLLRLKQCISHLDTEHARFFKIPRKRVLRPAINSIRLN